MLLNSTSHTIKLNYSAAFLLPWCLHLDLFSFIHNPQRTGKGKTVSSDTAITHFTINA